MAGVGCCFYPPWDYWGLSDWQRRCPHIPTGGAPGILASLGDGSGEEGKYFSFPLLRIQTLPPCHGHLTPSSPMQSLQLKGSEDVPNSSGFCTQPLFPVPLTLDDVFAAQASLGFCPAGKGKSKMRCDKDGGTGLAWCHEVLG